MEGKIDLWGVMRSTNYCDGFRGNFILHMRYALDVNVERTDNVVTHPELVGRHPDIQLEEPTMLLESELHWGNGSSQILLGKQSEDG